MTRINRRRHYGAMKTLLLLFAITPTMAFRVLRRESNFPREYDPNNPAETCYNILFNSDVSGDGLVDRDEYMSFVGQLSDGTLNATNYIDLPFVVKINFVYLSCLCMSRPENLMVGGQCCEGDNGGIDVLGAGPGETPTATEEEYLTTVCSDTQGAINLYMEEITTSPTTNTITTSPIAMPSTLAPSTIQPTTMVPSTSAPLTNQPTTMMPSTLAPSTIQPTTLPPIISIAPISIQITSIPSIEPSMAASLIPTASRVPTTAPLPGFSENPSQSFEPSLAGGGAVVPSPNVPSEVVTPPDNVDQGNVDSLSGGGIAGIIIASALVGFAAYFVATNKRKREGEDPELRDVRNKDMDDLEAGMVVASTDKDEKGQDRDSAEEKVSEGEGKVSVVNPYSPRAEVEDLVRRVVPDEIDNVDEMMLQFKGREEELVETLRTMEERSSALSIGAAPQPLSSDIPMISGVPPSPRVKGSSDDSSSCGESGWSSSAGLSSLNTSSFDAGTDDGLLPATPSPDKKIATSGLAGMAAAGMAAAMAGRQLDAKPMYVPVDDDSDASEVSYDDSPPADDLLAISPINLPPQPPQPVQGSVTREDLNAAIEAGDWAVVGATAALLADTDRSSVHDMIDELSFHSRESSISDSSDSFRRTSTLDVEIGDRSYVDEGSQSISTDNKKIRAEVEDLVRRVVPDEINNLDEMMLQFKGREEELIETLRTMQERSLAQRARTTVQKTAKLEALSKASASRTRISSSSIDSASEASHYAGSGNSSESDDDLSASKKTNISLLEMAIERGDWRAVGETAAMMGSSDAAHDELGDSESSYSGSIARSQDRESYLDALIAKGDWAGIVHAAATYQAIDDHGVGGNLSTEEEREALAQAKYWQEIARQSKTDSSVETTKGAVDAAEWAISLARKRINETPSQEINPYKDWFDEQDDKDAKKPRHNDDESV